MRIIKVQDRYHCPYRKLIPDAHGYICTQYGGRLNQWCPEGKGFPARCKLEEAE